MIINCQDKKKRIRMAKCLPNEVPRKMLINFDFDGVIADTFEQLLHDCQEAQKILGRGRAPLADDFRTLEDLTFRGLGRRLGMKAEEIKKFQEITFSIQAECKPSPRFYQGIVDVIKELSTSNTLTIVSSSNSEIVLRHLAENGIGDLFTKIMGGETGMSKRESILTNMSHFLSPIEDTYMIGDAVSDIRNGKAAEVKTIGVTWGFQSREILEAEAPDRLVDSPEQLLDCLLNLSCHKIEAVEGSNSRKTEDYT